MRARCCIRAATGVLFLGACAIARPDVDSILPAETLLVNDDVLPAEALRQVTETAPLLVEEPLDLTTDELAARIVIRLDQEAALLRRIAEQHLDDREAQLAASRGLFLSAEARVLRASLGLLASEEKTDLIDLIEIEDRLPSDLRAEVLSLGEEGLRFAEHASELADDREARQIRATLLSMTAWAQGPTRALLSGDGRALQSTVEELVGLDAEQVKT